MLYIVYCCPSVSLSLLIIWSIFHYHFYFNCNYSCNLVTKATLIYFDNFVKCLFSVCLIVCESVAYKKRGVMKLKFNRKHTEMAIRTCSLIYPSLKISKSLQNNCKGVHYLIKTRNTLFRIFTIFCTSIFRATPNDFWTLRYKTFYISLLK